MAHHDLYASLVVSRGASCEELSQEIERRLETGQTTNPGGAEELRVVLAVLGSPGRRARYDAVLDDPNTAPLTYTDGADLAAARGGRGIQAGATPSPAAPPEAQTKRPRKLGVILAVVIAVVALVAAAVLGLLLLRDGSGTGEAASMSFVESAGLWYFVRLQD